MRFNSDWSGYSADFGSHPSWDVQADGPPDDRMPHSGAVSIGAYTAVILSQDDRRAHADSRGSCVRLAMHFNAEFAE